MTLTKAQQLLGLVIVLVVLVAAAWTWAPARGVTIHIVDALSYVCHQLASFVRGLKS